MYPGRWRTSDLSGFFFSNIVLLYKKNQSDYRAASVHWPDCEIDCRVHEFQLTKTHAKTREYDSIDACFRFQQV